MAVHTDPTATATDAVVAAEAAARFAELMDGYLGTQLLYVAAELDLMEAAAGRAALRRGGGGRGRGRRRDAGAGAAGARLLRRGRRAPRAPVLGGAAG